MIGLSLSLAAFRPASSPFVAPTLVPGATAFGTWSATTQPGDVPANMGNPGDYGYSLKAIADWDHVPYQTHAAPFNLGVVAFHTPTAANYSGGVKSNISKVSFSADGGAWTDATVLTTNPDTGVVEYFVRIIPANWTDGPHEIRFVAYPETGVPFIGQGAITSGATVGRMVINTNGLGSLATTTKYVATTGNDTTGTGTSGNPYATISKAKEDLRGASALAGGVINLAAGSYTYGAATENFGGDSGNRWLTIQASPGLTKSDVTITGSGSNNGVRVLRVNLRTVTITGNVQSVGTVGSATQFWLHGSEMIGPGQTSTSPIGFGGWTGTIYATDSIIRTNKSAFIGMQLVRGCTAYDIGEQGFNYSKTVINSTLNGLASPVNGWHPDVWWLGSSGASVYNTIGYGVTATGSIGGNVVFNDGSAVAASDVALINCNFDNVNNGSPVNFYNLHVGHIMDNVMISNTRIAGNILLDTTQSFTTTSFSFIDMTLVDGAVIPVVSNVRTLP